MNKQKKIQPASASKKTDQKVARVKKVNVDIVTGKALASVFFDPSKSPDCTNSDYDWIGENLYIPAQGFLNSLKLVDSTKMHFVIFVLIAVMFAAYVQAGTTVPSEILQSNLTSSTCGGNCPGGCSSCPCGNLLQPATKTLMLGVLSTAGIRYFIFYFSIASTISLLLVIFYF